MTRGEWAAVRTLIQKEAESNTGAMYDMPWWWEGKVEALLDTVEKKLELR